ncbi:hypothetical protein [uncultured Sanguibacteroides sp.]|uniref:hypothetical protein n=1 Tax=uncultured Sanguibacteroides sp. TaxID=1635151 RepID=UPI0025D2F96D|nr:hypothetical protein [uncultured Sanguibacteroides sp.]
MKTLKIFLTLCVLSISSSLFASEGSVLLSLIPPVNGKNDVVMTQIESRENSESRWTIRAKVSGFIGLYQINNLPVGKEFQFRVILISKYGAGEPSWPEKFYKILDPKWGSLIIDIRCNPPAMPKTLNSANTKITTNYSNINGILNKKTTKVPLRPKE